MVAHRFITSKRSTNPMSINTEQPRAAFDVILLCTGYSFWDSFRQLRMPEVAPPKETFARNRFCFPSLALSVRHVSFVSVYEDLECIRFHLRRKAVLYNANPDASRCKTVYYTHIHTHQLSDLNWILNNFGLEAEKRKPIHRNRNTDILARYRAVKERKKKEIVLSKREKKRANRTS